MTAVEGRDSAVVIGSGPAGVAAAHALSHAGRRVTLLDAGDVIEPGRMEVFDALGRLEPELWPPEMVKRARGAFAVDVRHVPLKPVYGSLFPYAIDDPDLPITRVRAETLASLARGGLSNSWGASILPFRERDIESWPVRLHELEPHYRAVLRFVPIAGEHDGLQEILPLYTDAPAALRRGPQAEMVLARLREHTTALRRGGFNFGASRLAVAAAAGQPRACRESGMCLHGCPYGSIYNAAQTLRTLMREHKVDYRGGVYVDRLTEGADGVTIDFHERGCSGETGRRTAARVFLACGAISSTRLMFDSMGRAHFTRRFQDSQYFVLPMLTPRAAHVSVASQGNTLAQVFVEVDNQHDSQHGAHLQLYGYNDVMLAAGTRKLPVSPEAGERMLRPILGRMVIVQGYLHSSDSPGFTVRQDAGHLHVSGDDGVAGTMRVKKLVRRLARAGRLLGMFPVPGLVQIGLPGKGNHFGGSMPMRGRPGELETDTLGRLPGWSRVHVVDAAIFPSMPATTVTLSVMANAHRIASVAAAMLD